MVTVAVAGGTSPTLGRSIVEALVASGHETIILSRHSSSTAKEIYNAPIKYVSYDDESELTSALNNVHTVISVLKIPSEEQTKLVHLNLLRASLATKTVRRFVPADFSMYPKSHQQVALLAHKGNLLQKYQELASASDPEFEVGQFENGMFMNYLGQRSPFAASKPEILAGLDDDLMMDYIDISQKRLFIPTQPNGEPAKTSMTHIDDIGRYVAAAVDLPPGTWPKSGILKIAGTTVTFDRVREILEKDCKISIPSTLLTVDECRSRKQAFDQTLKEKFDMAAFLGGMVAEMMTVACRGEQGGSWDEDELGKLCPAVKSTWDLREYLMEAWT